MVPHLPSSVSSCNTCIAPPLRPPSPLPNRQGLGQTAWSGLIPPCTSSASRLEPRQHPCKRMPRPHDPNTLPLPSLFTKTHSYRLTRRADVAPVPTIIHPTLRRGPVRAGPAAIHRFQVSDHLFTIIRCSPPPPPSFPPSGGTTTPPRTSSCTTRRGAASSPAAAGDPAPALLSGCDSYHDPRSHHKPPCISSHHMRRTTFEEGPPRPPSRGARSLPPQALVPLYHTT